MTGSSDEPVDKRLEAIRETLLGIANGSFATRAPRTFAGDPWDVLAFLANSTADEVEGLLAELKHERSELQRAQQQLVETEKLAALGRLAAGVAHEMNQPLTVVRTALDLLQRHPDKTVRDQATTLDLIGNAAIHMSRVVDSVRGFAVGAPSKVPAQISPLAPVRGAEQLLRPRFRDLRVHFKVIASEPLPLVVADEDRLRQVFVNLLMNACDAVEDRAGASISVEAVATAAALTYRVCDDGPGVPEHIQARLFEPFFSTKDVGHGMGLGLSVAKGVVADHGGDLSYESGAGGGACFTVTLPRSGAQ